MLRYELTIQSLKPALVPAKIWNSGAEASGAVDRAVDLPFFRAAHEALVHFAPHRLVRSYAEYRRLNADT
jgi:hypothetical protein